MLRVAAVTYLAGTYSSLFTASGILPTDSTGNLKEPIDDSLRALGYSEAELATADTLPDEETAYYALLRWTTLEKVYMSLAMQVDVTIGQDSKKYNQRVDAVKAMLEQARSQASSYVDTNVPFDMVTLNLDIYEPVER